jgi:hypothetical protein
VSTGVVRGGSLDHEEFSFEIEHGGRPIISGRRMFAIYSMRALTFRLISAPPVVVIFWTGE